MAERLLNKTCAGSIVLLHDAIFRSLVPVTEFKRHAMLTAVELFLQEVGTRLRFVTLPELVQRGAVSSDESLMAD